MYELRPWFGTWHCLYTDDPNLKDFAVRSPDLHIATSYFRGKGDTNPFAWDIVGRPELVAEVAGRFSSRRGARRRARAS